MVVACQMVSQCHMVSHVTWCRHNVLWYDNVICYPGLSSSFTTVHHQTETLGWVEKKLMGLGVAEKDILYLKINPSFNSIQIFPDIICY